MLTLQYERSKFLSVRIWEIRVIFSGDIFRLLGFFESNGNFIITNGFVKKTQKTPVTEIKIAEERKKDYNERKRRNE